MPRAFASHCGLPADPAITDFVPVKDCSVPKAPPPIVDFHDLTFDPPVGVGAGGASVVIFQGPPGPPGGPGGTGPVGPPGPQGESGSGPGKRDPGQKVTFVTGACGHDGAVSQLVTETWSIPGAEYISTDCVGMTSSCCPPDDRSCEATVDTDCCPNVPVCLCAVFTNQTTGDSCHVPLRQNYDADSGGSEWVGTFFPDGSPGYEIPVNLKCMGGGPCSWYLYVDGVAYGVPAASVFDCPCDSLYLYFKDVEAVFPCTGTLFGNDVQKYLVTVTAGTCDPTACHGCSTSSIGFPPACEVCLGDIPDNLTVTVTVMSGTLGCSTCATTLSFPITYDSLDNTWKGAYPGGMCPDANGGMGDQPTSNQTIMSCNSLPSPPTLVIGFAPWFGGPLTVLDCGATFHATITLHATTTAFCNGGDYTVRIDVTA